MDAGGIETLVMNLYRCIDRNLVQFDFLLHRESKGFYDDEIKKMGGRMYYVPSINPFHHRKYIESLDYFFLTHHEYKIVHAHINAYSFYVLRAAAKARIPIRIAHSHIANPSINLKAPFVFYCKLKIKKFATHLFACSEIAGEWLFGKTIHKSKKFHIIKNAIDSKKYTFDANKRSLVRKELLIDDKFVFIHVGRFVHQKNHRFLIDFIKQYYTHNSNISLLLLGEGEDKDKIKKMVQENQLDNVVKFLGVTSNVNEYLSASDCFLFPSLFEGLGIVAIEAQTAGLLTICSDKVPKEANISPLYHSVKLDVNQWVNEVLKNVNYKRLHNNFAFNSGYDIGETANWLQDFYIKHFVKENL